MQRNIRSKEATQIRSRFAKPLIRGERLMLHGTSPDWSIAISE
jgi:hypothetical protein